MEDEEVIILLDFAENDTFKIQDEIQANHWNQWQTKLHPISIYFKTKIFCEITNTFNHNKNTVHSFLKLIT